MTQQNERSLRGERMLSVRETAEIMGWCLDSVRRKLRSGELPGVRLGRNWRVPESHLAAFIGVENIGTHSNTLEEIDAPSPRVGRPRGGRNFPLVEEIDTEVIDALLRTGAVRDEVLELVRKALHNTRVSQKVARQTLNELSDLLRTL